jgi:transcriptional regulator with XRE-family HTH domain
MVESLSGYVSRLAQAHTVSTGNLITKELQRHLSPLHESLQYRQHLLHDGHVLNGIGSRANDWVSLLMRLTGCKHLRTLTMLTWKHCFSELGLLRTERAWCSECYEEWRLQDRPAYEPLLWMLRSVSVCHIHNRLLMSICPYCDRKSRVLSAKGCSGYCSLCYRWLGSRGEQKGDGDSSEMLGNAVGIAKSISTLLAAASSFAQPVCARIMNDNIQHCVDDLAENNRKRFCRAVALAPRTVARWLEGTRTPSFANLVASCHQLGIPLVRFLTAPLKQGDEAWERAREIIKKEEAPGSPEATRRHVHATCSALRVALKAPVPLSPSVVAANVGYKHAGCLHKMHPKIYRKLAKRWMKTRDSVPGPQRHLLPEYQQALQNALRQTPSPSLQQLAAELGVYRKFLSVQFPALSQQIVRRFRAQRENRVKAILEAALVENPAPTLRQIEKRIGRGLYDSRSWFRRIWKLLAMRSFEERKQRLRLREEMVRAALSEEPPISGNRLASRMGVTAEHLRERFPQLMRAVAIRYAAYISQQHAERREAFRQQVRRAAEELTILGIYPSQQKILDRIPSPALKSYGRVVIHEARLAAAKFTVVTSDSFCSRKTHKVAVGKKSII